MAESFTGIDDETKQKLIKDGLDKVYNYLYANYDRKNPEQMNKQEKARQIEILHSLIVTYGAENVWDEFITHNIPDHAINILKRVQPDILESQKKQTARVELQEAGINTRGTSATFGIEEPGYQQALADELPEIAEKTNFNTLLLGAMSYHSANEFAQFSKKINERVIPTAVDMEDYSLSQADPKLVRTIKTDARNIPLPDKSQDVIFSNQLLEWLRKEGLMPSGEVILAVLREAFRLIKDGGCLVMSEKTPSYEKENLTSWMALLLLEATLKDLGFDKISDYSELRYPNHLAKKSGNLDNIYEDKKSERGKFVPFHFIVKAKKKESAIPLDYKETTGFQH